MKSIDTLALTALQLRLQRRIEVLRTNNNPRAAEFLAETESALEAVSQAIHKTQKLLVLVVDGKEI